jgi:adenylylsulfate kinase
LKPDNIHPVFDKIVPREAKEAKLGQRAKVIWFTGLSGSGKTTLAVALEKYLAENNVLTQVLDGDNIRTGINSNLGFSHEDRMENIRRIAEISKLFLNCGIVTINCFVSPAKEMREMARKIVGQDDFLEIYVNTSLELCEQRDVKGLYAKARSGEIKDFTGVQDGYEAPEHAELEIKTDGRNMDDCLKEIVDYVLPLLDIRKNK